MGQLSRHWHAWRRYPDEVFQEGLTGRKLLEDFVTRHADKKPTRALWLEGGIDVMSANKYQGSIQSDAVTRGESGWAMGTVPAEIFLLLHELVYR